MKYMIVCFTLNIFMLPLFCVNVLITVENKYNYLIDPEKFAYDPGLGLGFLTGGLQTISAIALLFLTLFSGAAVFDYCVKSERTDTFGGLPVTLRGRFFADFLSGFVTRVAPIIPCAVFSVIMSVPIEKYYAKIARASEFFDGMVTRSFAELSLALLITYTFAYILSVLITICCGKTSSSAAYTAVSTIVLMIGSLAVIGFIAASRMITENFDDALYPLKYVPPLGTFFGKANPVFDEITYIDFDEIVFEITKPAAIIVYTVAAAALIGLSYLIFKRRKPENTGHSIAVRRFYYFFAGACSFSLICICCWAAYPLRMWWLSALIAAVVSAVTLIIFTVASKYDRSRVKNNLIRNASIIVGSIAFLFIFDRTGAFGTRYYNYSAANTKSIEIKIRDSSYANPHSEYFVIDDKADIEQFIASVNKTLKNRADELETGGSFDVTYYLENGKEIYRSYDVRYAYQYGEQPNAIKEMFENVYDLPNYTKYSSESAHDMINQENASVDVVMHDKFGTINIPSDRVKEFGDILAREMLEKFDKNAKNAGVAAVDSKGWNPKIPILECYTDTIAFAEGFRVYDGEEEAFMIETYNNNGFNTTLSVKIKNAGDAEEKELFSLFEPRSDEQYYSSSGFYITSSNQISYYMPDENKERALDLILTIIEKSFVI